MDLLKNQPTKKMKLKLTNAALTGLIRDYIDILNDSFIDREFRINYLVEDITHPHHEVSFEYRLNDSENWLRLNPPTTKKQLLEIVKSFELGAYMYRESIDDF